MGRVAFVLTSHAEIAANGESTGVWIEEFATPYYAVVDAGCAVALFSPQGGAINIAPQSLVPPADSAPSIGRWRADRIAQTKLANTRVLTELASESFDALIVPGGHGALWDLADHPILTERVAAYLQDGRIVAAICHGPAALLSARRDDGRPWLQGRRVAAFTNAEEQAAGLADSIPLALETALDRLGARHEKAAAFEPCAVRDGNLITGQNPASADTFAALLIAALHDRSARTTPAG